MTTPAVSPARWNLLNGSCARYAPCGLLVGQEPLPGSHGGRRHRVPPGRDRLGVLVQNRRRFLRAALQLGHPERLAARPWPARRTVRPLAYGTPHGPAPGHQPGRTRYEDRFDLQDTRDKTSWEG